ncbi:MAG: hypothetical protein JGK01_09460 [Microcoleus sp. PH2017_03_ELD_O_A]|uniref:hypothetical protein n=1 Tax=unclassified Microcoleus TaxID=2642155 RepID=UPI001D8750CB|nr:MULTISPECIES: hypothetical protein [unclassified Microcoleus]MCC3442018.1 hypothetical protein [Microcoleus sp. PH2017_03_ELD_O_A]MCC3503545.1 hypothetical protein [Microcoleus sp. PH2017_19_SFW_U_A]MCC3521619.1 hypothetical protein [Microcoleus sp. PH2017_20_SFW_D_A]MCC3553130.1 hypothetical protein [Microcoleus sp. PH2017_35_SFW_U_B]MCC3565075.1 hypothetical protein [Microcoleus sp. PH2017_31_RDM_U_A]
MRSVSAVQNDTVWLANIIGKPELNCDRVKQLKLLLDPAYENLACSFTEYLGCFTKPWC